MKLRIERMLRKRRRTSTKEIMRLKRRKKKRKGRTTTKGSRCFWIDRIQTGTPNLPTNL